MWSNTVVRAFSLLVVTLLVSVTLHWADYIYFGIKVYEDIVTGMFIGKLDLDILNPFKILCTVL